MALECVAFSCRRSEPDCYFYRSPLGYEGMYIYTYTYVYMYLYMYEYMYRYTFMHMHIHIHIDLHALICTNTYTHIYTLMCISIHASQNRELYTAACAAGRHGRLAGLIKQVSSQMAAALAIPAIFAMQKAIGKRFSFPRPGAVV